MKDHFTNYIKRNMIRVIKFLKLYVGSIQIRATGNQLCGKDKNVFHTVLTLFFTNLVVDTVQRKLS